MNNHIETLLALIDADRRAMRSVWAAFVWEVTYTLRLDRLLTWLDSKLDRGGASK